MIKDTDSEILKLDQSSKLLDQAAVDALTPAERRRRRVRELILNAADRVFAQEGVEGLSIRRLADEIDYSPGAIYKYFGSKEDLVEELKEAFFGRLTARLEETRAAHDDIQEQFRACIATYVDTALERPHHYIAAFSGVHDENPVLDDESWCAFTASNSGRAYAMLKDIVAEGVEAGVFLNIETSGAAKSLWASMHGVAVLMIHLPHFPGNFPDSVQLDRQDFIKMHADLLVRGISAPKSN